MGSPISPKRAANFLRPSNQNKNMKIRYTVDKIHEDKDEGSRVVELKFGTAYAGTVTDYEGQSIHPLVAACSSWKKGQTVLIES